MTPKRGPTADGRLFPCPARPNCISSDADDEKHRVSPLRLLTDAETFWQALRREISARPRTRIVTDTGDHLHAEEKSRLFGFVDDIDFVMREPEGVVAVRSASRTGYTDFGVNRKRIEEIRNALQQRGVCG